MTCLCLLPVQVEHAVVESETFPIAPDLSEAVESGCRGDEARKYTCSVLGSDSASGNR